MFEIVYVAGAAWLAVLLAYYYAARRPLWGMPVGGIAVALAFIVLYPWITSFFTPKPLQDLAAFEQSRKCIQDTIGAVATHVSFAADVVFTVASILALFTLGLSYAIASIIVEALIDAVASFTNGVIAYLGFGESVLGALAMVVRLTPAFSSIAAPLLATFIPDRRGAATAAAVAALPIALTAPFLLAPPLEPLQCGLVDQPVLKYDADVYLSSNAPLVWVFNGTALVKKAVNGTITLAPSANVTAVYGAFEEGRVRLPAGNYTVYAVWSFFPIYVGNFLIEERNATYLNATIANKTAHLPDLPISMNITARFMMSYVDGWTFSADEAPNAVRSEGGLNVYEYLVEYRCYGTTSDCPVFAKALRALGQIASAEVKVLEASYVDYSYHAEVSPTAEIGEKLWQELCKIGEVPGGYCTPYSRPNASYVYIVVRPTPVYECNNQTCWEVPVQRDFKAKILFKARPTTPPFLAGIQYNGHRTFDVVQKLFGNMSIIQIATLAATDPAALGAVFAKNVVENFLLKPLDWVLKKLIPYLLTLIFAEAVVLGGVAGVAILVGGGNVFWRWLNIGMIARWHWRYDPIRSAMGAGIRVSKALGRGGALTRPVTIEATKEVTKEVVKDTVKRASMKWLALAAGLRAAYTVYYGDWYLWPAYLAGAGLIYRDLRKTDFALSRREALARAAFHTFVPAGHELAQRIDSFIYWARMAAHLRVDAFAALAARELHKAYQENLELTGSRPLAAELTFAYARPVSATEAAFYIMFVANKERLKGVKYFYPLLGEVAKKASATEEDVARRWMSLYGYDYDRLKEALQKLGLDPTPQTVVMLPKLESFSETAAQRLIEMAEFRLAAAFSWTEAVRRFEEKYNVKLEDLGNNVEAAWRRYVTRVLAEEWTPLRRGLVSLSEIAETEATLRWLAEHLAFHSGQPYLQMGDVLVPLDKAALAYPDVYKRLYSLVEGIIPEEVFHKAMSSPETAMAMYQLASELPPLDKLADRWAKFGEPEQLVREADKLVDLGRHDLAERLRDAAELAAMARAAQASSLPIGYSPRDLAELTAGLGLTEEEARFVLEKYGSYAIDWLRDAEPPAEKAEPSRLAEHLARAPFYKEDAEAAARELEEILGWRPTEEQVKAVAELFLKEELSAASLDHEALAEKLAEHVERHGWAEVPPQVADFMEGYKLVEGRDSYIALRDDKAELLDKALQELREAGAAVVEDPVVAMALARMGYDIEPYAFAKWTAYEKREEAKLEEAPGQPPPAKEPIEKEAHATLAKPPEEAPHVEELDRAEPLKETEAVQAGLEVVEGERQEVGGEFVRSQKEEPEAGGGYSEPRLLEEELRKVWTEDESKMLRAAERLMELAAEYGVFMSEEEAKKWAREHGSNAPNAWAEEYAEKKYGEWAREYVEEVGWKGLETLKHYEEVEKEARRLGLEAEREELLKLAEKYGEEAAERLKDAVAEKLAKEFKADFDTVRELLDKHTVDEAARILRERRSP